SGTGTLPSGSSTLTIVAQSPTGGVKEYPIQLFLYNTTMDAVVLQSPVNQQTDVPIQMLLTWEPYSKSNQFKVQVSTLADFSTILSTGHVNSTEYAVENLEPTTTYYWRVKPINTCGEGNFSNVYSFTTINISCISASNTTVVPISASGASTVSSTIDFLEAGSISQVSVLVNITHTWLADLSISLLSPSGTEVASLTQQCGNQQNINATFTDQGATLNCLFEVPTLSGQVLPEQPLSVLVGEP